MHGVHVADLERRGKLREGQGDELDCARVGASGDHVAHEGQCGGRVLGDHTDGLALERLEVGGSGLFRADQPVVVVIGLTLGVAGAEDGDGQTLGAGQKRDPGGGLADVGRARGKRGHKLRPAVHHGQLDVQVMRFHDPAVDGVFDRHQRRDFHVGDLDRVHRKGCDGRGGGQRGQRHTFQKVTFFHGFLPRNDTRGWRDLTCQVRIA